MGAIRQKLHSRRGASMLMALLFFLLVSMVGAVVLAAATANADKLSGRRTEQQDYMALSSAARLLQDTIGGTTCVGSERKQVHGCVSAADAHSDSVTPPEIVVTEGDEKLCTYLASLALQWYASQTAYNAKQPEPVMPVTFAVQAQGMKDVSVRLTMDRAYCLVLELTLEDSPYAMTMVFQAGVTVADEAKSALPGRPTCTHVHEEKVLQPDGTTKIESVSKTYDNFEYTRETTIHWPKGTITKGAVTGG